MTKLLFKIQLSALFSRTFKSKKKGQRSTVKKILIGLFTLYIVGALLFSSGMIMHGIYTLTSSFQMPQAYFSILAFFILVLCLIGSVFSAQSLLFEAKDNDLLLSMPIPPQAILLSRFLLLLLLEYLFELFLAIPAVVVYCMNSTLSAIQIVPLVLALVVLPFLSLACSCLIGWLLSAITARMRRKTLFYTFFYLLFFAAYFYVVSNGQSMLTTLMQNGGLDQLFTYVPPAFLFGKAVYSGDSLSLLYLLLWCILPLFLVLLMQSKLFIRIATTKKSAKKRVYKEKRVKQAPPRWALLRKELRRFFSLPLYIFNSAIGIFMELFLSVFLLIKRDGIANVITYITEQELKSDQLTPYLSMLIIVMLVFCCSATVTTSVSISLEGNRFWILQSAPFTATDVFIAKVGANVVIATPPLILACLITSLLLPLSGKEIALVFLLPLTAQGCFALLGMIGNVLFPRFDWTNETVVIKQSLSAFVGMIGSMALTALPLILYIQWLHFIAPLAYLLYCWIYFLLLTGIFLAYLLTAGKKKYERI
ncbi:MAG TPA: hypothetical protein DCY74_07725 [Clostridiales bacterium]|nr:hypothetical protein [Clostridiales bacterium]